MRTSVSPGKLKVVLDGYAKEIEHHGIMMLSQHLGGERGLRQRLDRDLGLSLVSKFDEREIAHLEELLESEEYIYPEKRRKWEARVAQFRSTQATKWDSTASPNNNPNV